MLGKDRNRDLLEVFNDTWKANHNDDVKRARTTEKQFINKMFDVKGKKVEEKNLVRRSQVPIKPIVEAKKLNDKIERTVRIERQNEVKRFTDRYK